MIIYKSRRQILKEFDKGSCGEITTNQLRLTLEVMIDLRDLMRFKK